MSPLTLEEENKVLAKLKENDEAAREELILHNMRLVAHVIKKYAVTEEDKEELLSIGTIGLIKAASTFNPDYGNKFATYAIMYTDSNVEKLNIAKVDQTQKVTPWILFGVFVLLMILFGVLVERKRRSRVE